MELKFNITEKDYLHYAFQHIRKWRSIYYHIILLSISGIIGFLCLMSSAEEPLSFIRITGIVLLSVVTFFILILALSYFRLKKEYASNAFLKETMTFRFEQPGFRVETSISHAEIEWTKVIRIKQSKKVVAIYIANSQAYILPKSQIKELDKKALLDIFKTHLSSSVVNEKSLT